MRYDWRPYVKVTEKHKGDRHMGIQTQKMAKKRALKRTQLYEHPDLKHLASKIMRK